jgi:CelD/BcsL family acetyltransferase involved in cellulose biosynthesis
MPARSPDPGFRLRPLTDPALLEAAWRRLEARADPAFCLSWTWIGCWLRQLPHGARPSWLEIGPADAPLGLAVLVPATGWRHGILPVRRWLLHESGDAAVDRLAIEDNGLLLDPACDPVLVRRALAWLPGALEGCDELVMRQVAPGIAALAREALAGAGMATRLLADDVRRWVDLQRVRAAGDYLSLLGANTRQSIRRARRAYAALGPLRVQPARSAGEALAFFDRMRPLHEARWQAKGKESAFASPAFAPFHRRLIATSWSDDPAGCGVQLLEVSAGTTVIGYLYNLLRRGWVHNYQGGFAYAADPHLKPGLVCHAAAIEQAAAAGAVAYDLMAGDSRYKASLAAETGRLVSLEATAPRPLLRLEAGLRELGGRWRRPAAQIA